MDNGYHDIYVAEAQARRPVVRFYASIGLFVRQQYVENTAIVTLIHENDATTVLQVSWAIDGGGHSSMKCMVPPEVSGFDSLTT